MNKKRDFAKISEECSRDKHPAVFCMCAHSSMCSEAQSQGRSQGQLEAEITGKTLRSQDILDALDAVDDLKTQFDAGKRLAEVIKRWEEEGEDREKKLKWYNRF